jgi:hypothetical protein
MRAKTRNISITSLLIALTVVLLYIASIIPSARIAAVAVAGLMTAAAVIECGILSAVACFACSSILAMLLLPLKSVALLYILFFGYYPIIKSLTERLDKRVLEWAIKIAVFNASLTLVYFLWKSGFMTGIDLEAWMISLLYAAGNLIFVLYDIAFSALAGQYTERIHKKR